MNTAGLDRLWETVGSERPADDELFVHKTGITSLGHDLCVGCDSHGRRHFLVPAPSASGNMFQSAGLVARARPLLRGGGQFQYLDLYCLEHALHGVFSHLVLDVLQSMAPDEPRAVSICLETLDKWKDLLGSGNATFGRDQVIGLVGELVVLERLASINPDSLAAWDGPLGGLHDFRSGSSAIEVKASARRNGRFFSISGCDQLNPPPGGDLHLATVRLQQSAGGSASIPVLLDRIRRTGVNPVELARRLKEIGYAAGNDAVDGMRFDVTEFLLYCVAPEFPRIVPTSFSPPGLPRGVLWIEYEIDLTGPLPAALSSMEAEKALRAFAISATP